MRADEIRGIGELGRVTLRGSTNRVAELHRGIADRAFGAIGPSAEPVKAVHDTIAGLAYGRVGVALGRGARGGGIAPSLRAEGRDLDADRAGRVALAILNGAHGDVVQRDAPALATTMGIRVDGLVVPPEPDALRAAFPDATGRLVVFLHGLTETEASWRYRAERSADYATRLRADLGLTPVQLRYNTGLHVSDNGRALDELLGRLAAAWPE